MSDPDDPPGGSPVCYLDEVDPAYAGYLTDPELQQAIEQLLAHERGAIDLLDGLRAHAPDDPLLAALADQFAAAARLLAAAMPARADPARTTADGRFVKSADSPGGLVQVAEVAAGLVLELEALLPRISSNACHTALNQALGMHRDQLARLPPG